MKLFNLFLKWDVLNIKSKVGWLEQTYSTLAFPCLDSRDTKDGRARAGEFNNS